VLGLLLILSAFGNLGHCPRLVFSTGGAGERELVHRPLNEGAFHLVEIL